VSVARFEEILLWPLVLKGEDRAVVGSRRGRGLSGWVKAIAGAAGSTWRPVPVGDAVEDRRRHYEEVVYFHPFVRDFLYGDDESPPRPRPLRVLWRDDVRGVRIDIGDRPDGAVELDVNGVELYVFDTRVALLVVRVRSRPGSLSLDDVLELQDQFRRAYPRWWYADDRRNPGDRCPARVQWLDAAGTPIGLASDYEAQATHRDFVRIGAEPPMSSHWAWLIHPLAPYTGPASARANGLVVQQVVDERIPAMSYLAVDRPEALSADDFVRIGLYDPKPGPTALRYSAAHLKDFEQRHCYDIFWDPSAPTGGGPPLTTRYLCCGYGFTAVGAAGDPFFVDDAGGVPYRFQHAYFKMGLIAQFHHASLLAFSDRLSEAVSAREKARHRAAGDRAFRQRVRQVQDDLVRFRSRYWFTELTNQVQGKALFDLWTRHLATERLFAQVLDETRTVNDIVAGQEQVRRTEASMRLTAVATVGLSASLALSLIQTVGLRPAVVVRLMEGTARLAVESALIWLALLVVALGLAWAVMYVVLRKADALTAVFDRWSSTGRRDA
jgi:hypothetical protein